MAAEPLQIDITADANQTIGLIDELDLEDGSAFPWSDCTFVFEVYREGCPSPVLAFAQGDGNLTADPVGGVLSSVIPAGRLCPGRYRHTCRGTHAPSGSVFPLYGGALTITEASR